MAGLTAGARFEWRSVTRRHSRPNSRRPRFTLSIPKAYTAPAVAVTVAKKSPPHTNAKVSCQNPAPEGEATTLEAASTAASTADSSASSTGGVYAMSFAMRRAGLAARHAAGGQKPIRSARARALARRSRVKIRDDVELFVGTCKRMYMRSNLLTYMRTLGVQYLRSTFSVGFFSSNVYEHPQELQPQDGVAPCVVLLIQKIGVLRFDVHIVPYSVCGRGAHLSTVPPYCHICLFWRSGLLENEPTAPAEQAHTTRRQ